LFINTEYKFSQFIRMFWIFIFKAKWLFPCYCTKSSQHSSTTANGLDCQTWLNACFCPRPLTSSIKSQPEEAYHTGTSFSTVFSSYPIYFDAIVEYNHNCLNNINECPGGRSSDKQQSTGCNSIHLLSSILSP